MRRSVRASSFRLGEQTLVVVSYPRLTPAEAPPDLTPAEREVMAALVAGLSTAEIARSRGTSVRTVSNQAAAVYAKLGVRSRSELAAWAATRPHARRR